MSPLLIVFFALNAAVSAFVGLGGGTFYLVLMDLFRLPYIFIPVIALVCNILVSASGAGIRLVQGERCSVRLLIFVLIPSMLCSYLGGRISFVEKDFRLILSLAVLVILGLRLLIGRPTERTVREGSEASRAGPLIILTSGVVGFASGIIGIGGGIILGPLLYLRGIPYLTVSLITALYIAFNSITGLIAQLQKILGTLSPAEFLRGSREFLALPVICTLSVLVSMLPGKSLRTEGRVKTAVLGIMLVLAGYNCFRAVEAYF